MVAFQSQPYYVMLVTLLIASTVIDVSVGFSFDHKPYARPISGQFSINRQQRQQEVLRSPHSTTTQSSTRLHAFALDGGAFSVLDQLYQNEPYLAAFLTCATKASAADWVAQSQQDHKSISRNLAFILYGGIYQGCIQYFIFSVLFPLWFPDPTTQSVLSQVAIDILLLGPLVCMPTVYTMKALFAGELQDDLTAGIKKYIDHVQHKGILTKYWSIWGPVQTLNFGVVPPHLRVVFVAMISFFWICLLSTVSSSDDDSVTEAAVEQTTQQAFAFATNPLPLPQPIPVPVFSDAYHHHRHQEQHKVKGNQLHVTASDGLARVSP